MIEQFNCHNRRKRQIRRSNNNFFLYAISVAALSCCVIIIFICFFGFFGTVDNDANDSIAIRDDNDHRKLSLDQFADPKSVTLRTDATFTLNPIDEQSRQNCQIVYIMGVEGATHHGFLPILENLAKSRVDPTTGLPLYDVTIDSRPLKAGILGWYRSMIFRSWKLRAEGSNDKWSIPELNDPNLVKRVVQEMCPPPLVTETTDEIQQQNSRKHVIIEWASFPSGQANDRRSYRIHRQTDWSTMTPHEIAQNDMALQHPFNLTDFYLAYSPLVDIKFVVLHRPFLDTITSHHSWDGGAEGHSNVIRGYMLLLRDFLDRYPYDLINTQLKSYMMVCVERITKKYYETEEELEIGRQRMLHQLATFLGWPTTTTDENENIGEEEGVICKDCFKRWRESTKTPLLMLGQTKVDMLLEHQKLLEGIWPPPGEEGVVEQQCSI